jgi:uncharacterized protein YbjT (DUF2867 family)
LATVTLVVGASGQVGFALVRRLRERGEEITALLRPRTDPTAVAATGARIVRGDLREPASLRSVCEGMDTVVATANTIVPRRGERADFDALARGYGELGRIARAAGVRRFVFVSVPRELIGRGALDFDAKGRIEDRLRVEGLNLVVVRPSLLMELWLPWLGSRLPSRGARQPTMERGFWPVRVAAAIGQRSLDRFGLAVLPGKGTARHAFIAVDDVAEALSAAVRDGSGIAGEVLLGGPEALSWREAAEVFGRVLGRNVRTIHQPTTPLRLATAARTVSPAASQLLASQRLVATIDSAYLPDHARMLLGRDPTSVEEFLRERRAAG